MPLSDLHCKIAGFLLILVLGGCNTPLYEEPEIIVTLDPEFTVDLFEQRNPVDGAPVFGLWIESMKQFNCGNYTIEAVVQVQAGAISVDIQEIQTPDTCQGAPGQAKGFLPVGQLANGTYRFSLSLSPVIKSEGTLSVQSGHYELSLPVQQGIDFQNRVLETIPDAYIWGYASTPTEPDEPVADQLVQNLKTLTQEPALLPGFYSYFTVSGAGQYFFHRSIAPMGQHRPFLRRLPGGPNGVRSVLEGYRNNPGQPLEVRCLSTFGKL
ncbi:MAG: hypothetical protein H6574_15995 [Lewinellaceae bacterium]|nr:hypothetical protein [Saprospiraceae bacterium]MCB9332584.1 hypothetical protein [Lewinellaceae bacterium]